MRDSRLDQLRNSWIANSAAWCDAVRNERIESRRLVTDAAILSAILERNPQRVLDVGCGEGWLVRALSARGIEVTGIDASGPLIEAARALGGGSFLTISYEDIAASPAAIGKDYDVIAANFSMLDDKSAELARTLLPALADGGRLIVQTAHPLLMAGEAYVDGWRTETFSAIPGEWPEAMPWYFRTFESWVGVFTSAGYAIESVREPLYPDRNVAASMIFVCVRNK